MPKLETANYEKRVVAFYDVLGWRDKISKAGNDPAKIGELRHIVLLHAEVIGDTSGVANVSTFSDNIVISFRPHLDANHLFLRMLANIQVASALSGFAIRGGVTIGEIFHDEKAVFGPALNRAYELESKIAKMPRILVDKVLVDVCKDISDFSVFEGGLYFLDGFKAKFAEQSLDSVLFALKKELEGPLEPAAKEKVLWLYNRVADQTGASRWEQGMAFDRKMDFTKEAKRKSHNVD